MKYDVIVVGAGNAALCAALSAAESVKKVLVLERAPESESGGNSRYTAGLMRVAYAGVDDLKRALRYGTLPGVYLEPDGMELTLQAYVDTLPAGGDSARGHCSKA